MTAAPLPNGSGPDGPVPASKGEGVDFGTRHRQTIRIVRAQGKANFSRRGELDGLPPPRPGESIIDWMVRAGLAPSPQDASAGLARALGLDPLLDELAIFAAGDQSGADAPPPPRPAAGAGATASPTPTGLCSGGEPA